MAMASFLGHDNHARISTDVARRVLDRVYGLPADVALYTLTFSPDISCPQVARILHQAISQAKRSGLEPTELVVGEGLVAEGEPVIRVRRLAHGMAGWITTQTTEISVAVYPSRERESS